MQVINRSAATLTPNQSPFTPYHIVDSYLDLQQSGSVNSLAFDFSIDSMPTGGSKYYWAFYFSLSSGNGAYVGFQNTGNLGVTNSLGQYVNGNVSGELVNFAVWNTVGGKAGPNGVIGNFSWEGSGVRAPSLYDFEAGQNYRVELQVQGATLSATVTNTKTQSSTLIGTINIPSGSKMNTAGTVLFSEVFSSVPSAGSIDPVTGSFSNFVLDGKAVKPEIDLMYIDLKGYPQNGVYGVEYSVYESDGTISMFTGGPGGNSFFASDKNDRVWLGPKSDTVKCGAGDDVIFDGSGSASVDGGQGLDRMVFSSPFVSLKKLASGWQVGADVLSNVERLDFSNKHIALDIDGNAGKVAKVLASVFGPSAVANTQYAGIGLGLLDGGMSYEALSALAIKTAGANARESVVDLLWTHLMGSHPSAAQAKPFVDMLAADLSNLGTLGVLAADYAATIGRVDMNALMQSGLAYS